MDRILIRLCSKAGNRQGAQSTVLGCEGDSTQRGTQPRVHLGDSTNGNACRGPRARRKEAPRPTWRHPTAGRDHSRVLDMLLLSLLWRSRAVAAALTQRDARAGKHRSSLTHRLEVLEPLQAGDERALQPLCSRRADGLERAALWRNRRKPKNA